MTVIAYRDGVMAADTMAVITDKRAKTAIKFLNEQKLIRNRRWLIGMAGWSLPPNSELIKWLETKIKGKKRLPFNPYKFELLVVGPFNKLEMITHDGGAMTISNSFYAIGSGAEFAIGAMAMGATAIEAVAVAIEWCPTCSGQVVSRSL